MEDTQNLQQKLQTILKGYNTTLQNCVNKVSDNNKLNQTVVNEIQDKIKAIKERVFTARNNVEEIGKEQTAFYNALEQEKGKILNEQKKHLADSAKEQERLQNQLKESQNQSATKIQELQARQKNEIQQMKEKAASEADELIRKRKAEDATLLETKINELNEKIEAAKRDAQAKADEEKARADKAKELADNERREHNQQLEKLKADKDTLMQTQGACEDKLANLNIEYQKLEEEITKLKSGLDKQINENSEDKKNAAAEKLAEIEQLNKDHGIAMEKQIKKASDDKDVYMLEAKNAQETAITEALMGAEALHKRLADEKSQATEAAQGNLEDLLEQCKQSKEAYEKEVEDHLAKYKVLEQQFAKSKDIAMDELQKLVERLGDDDIKSLEDTIDGILSKKVPGGTGTGEPRTISPLKRQTSTEVENSTIRMADSEIKRSKSLLDNRLTGQEAVGQLDEEKARRNKREPGNPKEAWGESHALAIDKTWVAKQMGILSKIKSINNVETREAIKKILLEGIKKYINNIGTYSDFADLKYRIVDPDLHGMTSEGEFAESYKIAMDSMDEANYKFQNQRHLYDRILVSMVTTYSGAYEHIIEEIIKQNGFEKVFEQLITAFHLLYSPPKIVELYKSGAKMKDSDMNRNGKLAIRLWSGNYDKRNTWEKVPVKDLKKNADLNRDRLSGNDTRIGMMHMYYHKHDAVAKVATAAVGKAFVGGFRHGKGSQKKNKRTLKSKLTAKKYSLKVGKKKRGERGNKSQKRRKSIKIRI